MSSQTYRTARCTAASGFMLLTTLVSLKLSQSVTAQYKLSGGMLSTNLPVVSCICNRLQVRQHLAEGRVKQAGSMSAVALKGMLSLP